MGKQRKKRPGKPLPEATDAEFAPEAMRAWGENEARKWWKDNAPERYKNLLEARPPEIDA